ncbi:MAG: type II toxin-antitoxin system RelE/ParE family toxin [Oscillospiraceae bacterium]|nr:type II toxin-antitoxin system RelE/ParE family toxin [Oscillospiraceae bacterium]MBQ4311572.1 type II toxin-antitoxin system RelE/ParE family toxin [Oscillospiraceae bacterium]
MTYSIHITNKCEHDIMEAADYIEFTLLNRTAADNLLDAVEEEIGKLSFMPEKYRIIDDPVLKEWKIRMIPVKNYLAFYVIDEKTHTVHIVRFLHSRRNWQKILGSEPVSIK